MVGVIASATSPLTDPNWGISLKLMFDDQVLRHNSPSNEVLLDDFLEHWRIALGVPGTLGIDHCDRSATANPQAVYFTAEHTTLLAEIQFFQPSLEIIPCLKRSLSPTADRLSLIATEQNVPASCTHSNFVRLVLLLGSNTCWILVVGHRRPVYHMRSPDCYTFCAVRRSPDLAHLHDRRSPTFRQSIEPARRDFGEVGRPAPSASSEVLRPARCY